MIKTENLSMVFTTEDVQTRALSGVNLVIKPGEFVAIMGPSGCGKSTLLNILGTLELPTSGRYLFDGKEMTGMSEGRLTDFRKKHIGFVFQSFNLIDELTVFENVELPLIYLGMRKADRRRKVTDVLQQMNIAHRAGHFPQQLSGGQQQRVAIARAVVTDCPLISGRRTDRQSGLRQWTRGDVLAAKAERRRNDYRYGHTLGKGCGLCPSNHLSAGWQNCGKAVIGLHLLLLFFEHPVEDLP